MKPYGSKKECSRNKRKRTPMIGDGCFLCTREKKTTKSANRSKIKVKIKKEL